METERREPGEETAPERGAERATPERTEGQAQAAAAPPVAAVETPIARPVPKRNVLTRRVFILGGFWSVLGLALFGMLGSPLDFAWPRKVAGGARKVFVSADNVPPPGGDPVAIPEGRFFLLNLVAGVTPNGEETPGGLLALWRKCPHLGCTVPWRPGFTFLGRNGWFRCPCHGSTYTKEGGILVAGPAPRPMDIFPVEVEENEGKKTVVVTTGVTAAIKGSVENPSKTVPFDA